MRFWFALLFIGYAGHGFAWNAEGHQVVAEIAWQNLTESAKKRFNPAHPALDAGKPAPSFRQASTWFDEVKTTPAMRKMHYIDIPYVPYADVLPEKVADTNALMAYRGARQTLLEGQGSGLYEVIALRVLIHVVADLHQPMHAVSRMTHKHPEGDAGGNKYKLPKNKVARNLHAYWDKGGGFLTSSFGIDTKARVLQKRYPCDVTAVDTDPMHWVAESYEYATKYAYNVNKHAMKHGTYQAKTYEIASKRLAEAGCRLAAVLNEIDAYGLPIVA